MKDTFHKLIAIASRVHRTDASRTDILQDLASITPEEYNDLLAGEYFAKEEAENLHTALLKTNENLKEIKKSLE